MFGVHRLSLTVVVANVVANLQTGEAVRERCQHTGSNALFLGAMSDNSGSLEAASVVLNRPGVAQTTNAGDGEL